MSLEDKVCWEDQIQRSFDSLLNTRRVSITSPIDPRSGGVEVSMQDQTTPPVDALFAQSLSNFTLAEDTNKSGITTLVYDFIATAGHGIIIGDELLLLDTAGDRSLQCVAINVVGDVVTIDRPIDTVFEAASALGRIVNTNMAVDGSVTPQIFSVRGGTNPFDFTRFLLTMTSTSSMDDGKFGSLPALTNGIVFRIVNGYQQTIFNFKTNGDIARFCFDARYPDKSPSGQFGYNARMTFNGPSKHGIALRISGLSVIQWIVQDDLTGLLDLGSAAEGHNTVGED